MARKKFSRREKPEYDQKLLELARVTRVVKGGRRFRFRAVLIIGNRNGKVGVGVAKGVDVSEAVRKAFNSGKKSMVQIKRHNNTIACPMEAKVGSAKVMIKPAKPGRGIVACGAVRSVIELAGIRDIVSKSMGSSNKLSVARATVKALEQVKALSSRNS
ncbi:MAG: 30S ribosomal protein S5 [Candidatus Moranbacteria bacterium RIFOXYA1_FULL_44_8]|nr:MAG: 30S ribosomal protein S5 [Candidatus Moranbacteria bacterium RIFOXYA1_FULL_44_8]